VIIHLYCTHSPGEVYLSRKTKRLLYMPLIVSYTRNSVLCVGRKDKVHLMNMAPRSRLTRLRCARARCAARGGWSVLGREDADL
jgi:hypothetical protein